MRSNQLSYPAIMIKNFVEIEGLEPSLTEPESVVLPLHHISIWLPFLNLGLQRYECFVKMQKKCEKMRIKSTKNVCFVLLPYGIHVESAGLLLEKALDTRSIIYQCKAFRPDGRFRVGK